MIWVRFLVGAQKRTSSEVNERAEGTREEEREKVAIRCATKPKGESVAKWAVLSLVSYPRIIFINFIKGKKHEQTKILSIRS